ncbi:MAG: preprotein translocase subunit SecG [Elusimicrobiota bacterium]
MLFYPVLILHVIACISLILIVLLQAGKSAGLAGLFGGGGGDNVFSTPSGGSFLKKVTITTAAIFALTSLTLTALSTRTPSRSVVERLGGGQQMPITSQPPAPEVPAEATPAPTAPTPPAEKK